MVRGGTLMKELKDMTEQEIMEEINTLIDSAPEEYKDTMLQLQWKCDAIRKKHGDNHVGAMVEISNLMWEHVGKLNKSLQDLTNADVTRN